MVKRHESGTRGLGIPEKDSSSPPWIDWRFKVERRAPSGTTGIMVCFWSNAGKSFCSISSKKELMCRIAESPRNGIEPCAILPNVSTSAHHAPRWPRQTRSTFKGSGIITWSTRGFEKNPFSAKKATPPYPPVSSSTVPEISITPEKSIPSSRMASIAITEAASPPFMSQVPRPNIFPSRTTPSKGSTDQPFPGTTTSRWLLKWTQGPECLPSKRAITLFRG